MARAKSAEPQLSLNRYREILNIPYCAFNGVDDPSEIVAGCDSIWLQWQREMVASSLHDAEQLLAQYLGFFLGAPFLTDKEVPWTLPMSLRWGHIIGGGIEGLDDVSADVAASDFTTDPATITIPTASFSSEGEIYIIETSTEIPIIPDQIVTSGVNYIISIEQCSLIEFDDLQTQTDDGIAYDGLFPAATWLKLADLTIYRRSLDDSDQATITFGPSCSCCLSGTACAGTSFTGCVYTVEEETSKVRVQIADFSAVTESWTCNLAPLVCGCHAGDKVSINYRAGTTDVPGWEQAVMRLAHTYMLVKPCGCAMFDFVLNRDRREPLVATRERINNPLGLMNGAWFAWQWLETTKHLTSFMLG